jgi:hypothetical protein
MSAKIVGLLLGAVTLIVATAAPASAEFFGCNEPRTKVSYSSPAYRHYAQAPVISRRYSSRPSPRRYASQPRIWQWH